VDKVCTSLIDCVTLTVGEVSALPPVDVSFTYMSA